MNVSIKPKCPDSIRSVINAVAEDFSAAFEALPDYNDGDAFVTAMNAIKRKWGFRLHRNPGCGGACYISRKHGIVIKNPYVLHRTIPRHAVFTKVINLNDDQGDVVYIQPLVDRSSRSKVMEAFYAINKFLGCETDSIYDFVDDNHHNNVGVFMGEAVTFDW